MQTVHSLDVTFDLAKRKYKSLREENNKPVRLNIRPSTYQTFFSSYPKSIEKQISETSSNKSERKRKRKTIWFIPLFSKNVKLTLAKHSYLCLLSKHIPPNHF